MLVVKPPPLSGYVYVEYATEVTTAGTVLSDPPPSLPPSSPPLVCVGVGSGSGSGVDVGLTGGVGVVVGGLEVVDSRVSELSVDDGARMLEDDEGGGGGAEDARVDEVEDVVVTEDDEDVEVLELLLNGGVLVDSSTVSVCIVKMISDSAVELCANAGPASSSSKATMTLSSELILRGTIATSGCEW